MKFSERFLLFGLFGLLILSIASLAWFQIKSPSATNHSASKLVPTLTSGVGVLTIDGPIGVSGGPFEESGIEGIVNRLYEISKDSRVKALVIRINSPGGTVGSSQELFREIEKFKKRTPIPVVVSVGDMCASGAYWVALSGDRIFANPGSLVGSIGVILSTLDLTEVKSRYGVGMKVVKSGPYKDLFSSWRTTGPEEQALLDNLIQGVYGQFVGVVATKRHLSIDEVKEMADGRVLTGADAKEAGLIDELGGFRDAVEYAAKQAKLSGEPNLIYQNRSPLNEILEQLGASFGTRISTGLTLQ